MQQNSIVNKKRIYNGDIEISGLIRVGEIAREKGQVDVPGFKVSRKISNGVNAVPAIELSYKLDRNTSTRKFWEDFYNNDEVKDLVCITTDAGGVEYKRQLWKQCECTKLTEPEYDALNPGLLKYDVIILPWDIIDVES